VNAEDPQELLDRCRRIAARAEAGEQIEAYASRGRETDIEVVHGQVDSLTVATSSGVGIRVVRDARQGFAWAGSLDDDVIDDALAAARDNARFAEPDEAIALATPADAAGEAVTLDLWRDDLASVATDDKVAFAISLDTRLRATDSRITGVESAGYGDVAMCWALATSTGVETSQRRTHASAYLFAMADDGSGVQTGYGVKAGRTFADLDAEEVVAMAHERATRLLGAQKAKSRRVTAVLDPLVTASLLGLVAAAFNGESMLKGRSLFAERAGDTVAAPILELADDPTDAQSLGAAERDAEGVPCRRNVLLDNGVMHGFLHNTYTARRAGTATTASAVRGGYRSTPGVGTRALRLRCGDRTPDELVADVGDGFYVQAVHGLHSGTNPISGDFSVGAEGLVIRDGALAEPVREVTIASTIPRMLLGVRAIGSDALYLPGGAVGTTIAVDDMTMSGE
jgi:PmbA protein